MAFYQFQKQQKLNSSLDEVWNFISTPTNLKEITPDHMGFDIITKNLSEQMYAGMIIGYELRPLFGIKTTWVTEITHIEEKKYFIDEQRVGPYTFWHHQHFIEPTRDGVLMTDIVSYKLPFGILGDLAHKIFIKKKIENIFDYRKKAIEDKFN